MKTFTLTKHGHSRFWAVRDSDGQLVCVCVYRRGAQEVIRRLEEAEPRGHEFPKSPLDTLRESPY